MLRITLYSITNQIKTINRHFNYTVGVAGRVK